MTLTTLQVSHLMQHLDKNGDGFLDYREFFDAFAVLDSDTGRVASPANPPIHAHGETAAAGGGGAGGGAGAGAGAGAAETS